jgi:hypothetical protein
MKRLFLFFAAWCAVVSSALSQQPVRGIVTDRQTLAPLVGAQVLLLRDSAVIGGSLTDEAGKYRIASVAPGRYDLRVTYLGYAPGIRANLIVNSAQELVMDLELEESVTTMKEVVIEGKTEKAATINELTMVSGRMLSMEEALRYAGSRNDPARMAQNFAGVSGVNDARNDIIIRGNSPTGVLWRLEGVDIPNPNHFGALGATGGPVSMLNNNNLSNADFITSAFPAEYGNALAGVFDLGLRNGNNEKYEFMGQIGFNGFEAGAEGPLGGGASFVANYRYSTLGVFKLLGINFGTGTAVPQYQDLTFKVNIPTEKMGRFVIFGVGGNSDIAFLDSESEEDNFFSGEGQDLYNRAAAGVVGLSHTLIYGPKTHGKITLAATGAFTGTEIDSLSRMDGTPIAWYRQGFTQIRYVGHYQLNHKFNARHLLRVGVMADRQDLDLRDSVRRGDGSFRRLANFEGTTWLHQAYAQWQYRITDRVVFNLGGHLQYLALNENLAIEPRAGLKIGLDKASSIQIGAGIHHQMQPLVSYFIQTPLANGMPVFTNQDLAFTRSFHTVLGYDRQLGQNIRFRVETYFQYLDQAAVDTRSTSFSMLNAGADFAFPSNDSLQNVGLGRNYGLELTLEKFFSNQYYFLTTVSLFESQYAGSDGVWRGTAFNGNYVLNGLGGREFRLGSNSLSVDAKATWAGGRRFTPIDEAASRVRGEAVLRNDQAWEGQHPDFFRIDLKATFRLNGKKVAQEWSLDMQNLTNRRNVFDQRFVRSTGTLETSYQTGLFPVIQYRALF